MKILQCKGGSSQVVEDNTFGTGPWEPQIPQVNKLFDQANQQFDAGGAQVFEGNRVADLNPALQSNQAQVGQFGKGGAQTAQQGQNAALTSAQGGAANPVLQQAQSQQGLGNAALGGSGQVGGRQGQVLQGTAGQATNALNANLSASQGGIPNIGVGQTQAANTDISGYLNNAVSGQGTMNPYLEQLVQGQANTATRAYNDNVLPAIRGAAGAAGQPGGTRAGIAEGIASSRLGEDITNITGQLYSNAFDRGQDTQNQAASLVAGSQDQGIGNQLQADTLGLNYDINRGQLGNQAAQISNQFGQGANQGLQGISSQINNLLSQGGAQGVQQQGQGLNSLGNLINTEGSVLSTANQGALQQQTRDQAINQAGQDLFAEQQNQPIQNLQQFQEFISGPYGSSLSGQENTSVDQFNTQVGQPGADIGEQLGLSSDDLKALRGIIDGKGGKGGSSRPVFRLPG